MDFSVHIVFPVYVLLYFYRLYLFFLVTHKAQCTCCRCFSFLFVFSYFAFRIFSNYFVDFQQANHFRNRDFPSEIFQHYICSVDIDKLNHICYLLFAHLSYFKSPFVYLVREMLTCKMDSNGFKFLYYFMLKLFKISIEYKKIEFSI